MRSICLQEFLIAETWELSRSSPASTHPLFWEEGASTGNHTRLMLRVIYIKQITMTLAACKLTGTSIPLDTCLVMQIAYVLLVRDKELMISLEQITSKEGPGENDQMKRSYVYSTQMLR